MPPSPAICVARSLVCRPPLAGRVGTGPKGLGRGRALWLGPASGRFERQGGWAPRWLRWMARPVTAARRCLGFPGCGCCAGKRRLTADRTPNVAIRGGSTPRIRRQSTPNRFDPRQHPPQTGLGRSTTALQEAGESYHPIRWGSAPQRRRTAPPLTPPRPVLTNRPWVPQPDGARDTGASQAVRRSVVVGVRTGGVGVVSGRGAGGERGGGGWWGYTSCSSEDCRASVASCRL